MKWLNRTGDEKGYNSVRHMMCVCEPCLKDDAVAQTMRGHSVTVVLKGGMGNQLFAYAAARRLALINQARLLLDAYSGFKHDSFHRGYRLQHFKIPQNLVGPNARRWPLDRYSRFLMEGLCHLLPPAKRPYLLEVGTEFDAHIYKLRLTRSVYMEGYWQNERHFADIASVIRDELQIVTAQKEDTLRLASIAGTCNSVCVHARVGWNCNKYRVLPAEYYVNAIRVITAHVKAPHYFVFSDDVPWV